MLLACTPDGLDPQHAVRRHPAYSQPMLFRSWPGCMAYATLPPLVPSPAQDVVLLQEVWVDGDARDLQAAAKQAGLVHSVHFRSGMFGSGLVTLSRHPIRQMGFFKYAASGSALELHKGDFHAGKGVRLSG